VKTANPPAEANDIAILNLLPVRRTRKRADRADDLAGGPGLRSRRSTNPTPRYREKRSEQRGWRPTVSISSQLDWLRDRLVASWRQPAVPQTRPALASPSGRICDEGDQVVSRRQTLAVAIKLSAGSVSHQRARRNCEERHSVQPRHEATPLESGAAHCLELLAQAATPAIGDAHIPWLNLWGACGYTCAVKRPEGSDLADGIEAADCTVA